MRLRHLAAACTAVVLSTTTFVATASPAQTAQHRLGTRSLATVLAADGHGFDTNPGDFDVLDRFVTRILRLKPSSRLAVLTHGGQRLTAFLPTDGAFRRTAEQVLDHRFASERRLFRALWAASGDNRAERIATSEGILLYHVVGGRTITYRHLLRAAPTSLTTLQGGTVRVRVRDGRVVLIDHDADSPNARVIPALRNINKGNRQIGHGISLVLSPVVS